MQLPAFGRSCLPVSFLVTKWIEFIHSKYIRIKFVVKMDIYCFVCRNLFYFVNFDGLLFQTFERTKMCSRRSFIVMGKIFIGQLELYVSWDTDTKLSFIEKQKGEGFHFHDFLYYIVLPHWFFRGFALQPWQIVRLTGTDSRVNETWKKALQYDNLYYAWRDMIRNIHGCDLPMGKIKSNRRTIWILNCLFVS